VPLFTFSSRPDNPAEKCTSPASLYFASEEAVRTPPEKLIGQEVKNWFPRRITEETA
jgi:hypothetical protein